MAAQPDTEARSADELRVLVLPPTRTDGAAIETLLAASGIACATCSDMTALCIAVACGAGTVLISEEALLADADLLRSCVNEQPMWSDLPTIVLSRSGAESVALSHLLPLIGNVSVVERPVRTSTLVSMIRSTLRARTRQYQVREHLIQQERAQTAIRAAEERYRAVLENIRDYAIFMLDTEGRVCGWNKGAAATLGYREPEVVGKSAEMFFLREEQTRLRQEMQEARASGRAVSTGWRLRKGGHRLFVEGLLIAVHDQDGELLSYAKFMKDITEKHRVDAEREHLLASERAARSEAERSSRMKDEFLATLSHELRTPLNAVLGWAQVLRRSRDLTPEVADGLSVIERNARSQAQIIADLLDMSSIIAGKVRLEVQSVDLSAVIDATIKTVEPAVQAKGIRLQVVLDRLVQHVTGDPHRLQQVFWNLLTNAVKFTPRDGRIAVSLKRVNSQVEVAISDSGEGIEPGFLPHVFDRFRQADASTSRLHGGLGLGLSIVKQLVELHGGTISADSGGKGAGSTFNVSLPLMALLAAPLSGAAHKSSPAEPASAPDSRRPELHGLRVLVVDDEPDARALIQRLLQDCDASVVTAGSAGDALEQIMSEAPDLLISDIGMPGEDGYTLIRRIRSLDGPRSRLPAIALTAYARTDDRVKAIQAGFQLHLAKPVEPIELLSMVSNFAKRRSG
jgi:PAS domain S-box-containing protein